MFWIKNGDIVCSLVIDHVFLYYLLKLCFIQASAEQNVILGIYDEFLYNHRIDDNVC